MKKIILVGLFIFTPYIANAESDRLPEIDIPNDIAALKANQFDDGSKLTDKYVSLKLAKDEFETSEEYRARISKIVHSSHYFAKKISEINTDFVSYDADTKILSINLGLSTQHEYGIGNKPYYPAISLKTTINNTGSYIGSNAYGAKAKVIKATSIGRKLVFSSYNKEPLNIESPKISGSINIDQDRAKKIKNNLYLVIVGDPDISKVKTEKINLPPKLDFKYDIEDTTYLIPIDLKGLYLYSPDEEKMLLKLDLQ